MPHARESMDRYESPLVTRYAGEEMVRLFSPQTKFRTWRRLWVALAEAERELGLPITERQVRQLRRHIDDIDYAAAARFEKETRHDVMAHVRAYGQVAPEAAGILHLGATSAYVTDNTDLLLLRDALHLVRRGTVTVLMELARFARRYRSLPVLGMTHLQPAQPTTVGRRACLWAQDLLADLRALDHAEGEIRFLGVRGATGTQASFLRLFDGNHRKVTRLDRLVARKMGFARLLSVTGQTYPRKIDYAAISALCGVSQSAQKFANDVRILQTLGEMEEPFGRGQIGSSAMAYKRNPMRSERITSLTRYVIALTANPAQTAAAQFLERTLDDSANRRIAIPEAFLATDGILRLYANVAGGLVVHRDTIRRRLARELPFLATEDLLMEGVRAGGDRQELHEVLRRAAHAAMDCVRRGEDNDLFARLAEHPAFAPLLGGRRTRERLAPQGYIGRSVEQTTEFLRTELGPVLRQHRRLSLRREEPKV